MHHLSPSKNGAASLPSHSYKCLIANNKSEQDHPMTSRTLKLLTASSAFVAAASGAQAIDAITTPTNSTVYISQTSAGVLTVGALISTTSSPAIAISSTRPAVVINNSSTIRTNVSGPAILLSQDTSISRITVNNSGTIIGGGGTAMTLTEQNAFNQDIDITIHNHGTITGDIDTGDGDVIYSGLNATQNGDITTGNGTNIVILNNSRINGSYTGGTGADTVTLTNSTVSGTLAGGTGTNVLNIDGDKTFTLEKNSLISGFQTINADTNVVINDGITGASIVNVAAAKTMTVNNSFNLANGGVINNDGTFAIAGGKTVRVDDYLGTAGSKVDIGIAGANSAGVLQFRAGSANGLNATSLTISVGNDSGYIVSGSRINIVDGDGASTAPTLLTSGTGVYRFSTVTAGNDVDLVIGRVSTSSVVKGKIATDVANAMDTLGTTVTDELRTVQSSIGQASNAAAVQRVVDSLTPSIEGAGAASLNVTVDSGNQISNRLASIRQDSYSESGVATGDPLATSHMWVEGLGSTVKQDDKDGRYGYDANSAGMSAGIDTDTIIPGITTGLAVTYAKSKVDSNSTSGATADIDTFASTLYGSRVFDAGFFINGQLGVGY
ncbi:MAG: autotransporter domain-containing protein, partial [Alphaproteobacteria bacterium]